MRAMATDMKEMIAKLELQGKEFDALGKLVIAYRNLPAVVDDNYPEMRHYYEGALKTFIEACKANGRI